MQRANLAWMCPTCGQSYIGKVAVQLARRALQRSLGEGRTDHEKLVARERLTLALSQQGQFSEAVDLQRGTYDILRERLGEEHPETLRIAANLAGILEIQGDISGAAELQRSTFEAHCRVLGPEHPETLVMASYMATSLQAQG